MLCYRAVDTTADEEGGGRSEKLFSAAKPLSTGTTWKVATMSQHTRTRREAKGEGLVNETK